jgi:hypothetical protein
MKKFAVIILVAATFAAHAQLSIKLGLGGQLSGFELTNPDVDVSSWRLGNNFNLTAQYGNRFFVESGLILVNSNQAIKPVVDITNPDAVTLSARLTSIHVPLHVGFQLLDQGRLLNFRIFGGLDMRTVVGDRKDSDYNSNDMRIANFGAVFGFGANFGIFYGDLTYHHGLTNVFKSSFDSGESNQHLVMLTFGVYLWR